MLPRAVRSATSRVRRSGLRASRPGRRRSLNPWRTAASKSGWESTRNAGARSRGADVDVLCQRALAPQLDPGVHRNLPEVVREQPVASIPDAEVGTFGAREIARGEVLVPPVRLGQGDEVPRQVRCGQLLLQGQDRDGVQRRRGPLIVVPVDHEPAQRERLAGPRWRAAAREVPGRTRAGVGVDVVRGGPRQIHDRQHPLELAVEVADDEEALRLSVQPPRRDGGRLLALPGPNQIEDRPAVLVARTFRVVLAPGTPLHRRHRGARLAEQPLQVEDRPQLRPPGGRSRRGQAVLAHLPEDVRVAVEVTPSQVGVENVASQVVRRHAIRPGLDEGQFPQPR